MITQLADTDAVVSAMDGTTGALAGMTRGSIWLQMSTIGEAGMATCAALADHHGVTFVDAPVLGSREPAEQRRLVVLASGPDRVRDQVQPIFDVLSKQTSDGG